jgi:PAS domain S-box-containing protein
MMMDEEPTQASFVLGSKPPDDGVDGAAGFELSSHALLEMCPLPMVLADLETGAILMANSALGELVGREVAALIGQPERILYAQDCTRPTRISARPDRSRRVASKDARVVTQSGAVREVQVRTTIVQCGGRKGCLGILCESSAEKQLERRVSAMADAITASARLSPLEALASPLIQIVDADGVMVVDFRSNDSSVQVPYSIPAELSARSHSLDPRRTPWKELLEGKACHLSDGRPMILWDRSLTAWGTEALIGIPLRDSGHRTIGGLVALYRIPIRRPSFSISAMRILASRAAGELERLRPSRPRNSRSPRHSVTPETLPRRTSARLRTRP